MLVDMFHKTCVIVVCVMFGVVVCAPAATKFKIPSHEALDFMKRYGYVQDDDGESEALYSESGISNIIKNIQKFGAIEQTGVIDNATLKLMSSRRCGVKDIMNTVTRHKRFTLGSEGWNKRDISYFISNWSPKLGEETVARNIQRALDTWGGYGRLNFRRSLTPDADIIVAFGRGYHGDVYPFDGPGFILAHAFFPYEQDGLGGDIHFDEDEKWIDKEAMSSDQGTDFYTVALHELGHSLGLAHSTEQASIMFPYYQGSEGGGRPQLGYDDILGMYQLYITRVLKDDNVNNGQYPDHSTRRPIHSTSTEYVTSRRTTRTTPWYSPHWTRPTTRPTTTTTTTTTTTRTTPTTTTTRYTTSGTNTTIQYQGDSESVDEHKKHDDKHHIPKSNAPSIPDICDGHVDAIATLRNELFVFRDEFIWRFKEKGVLDLGYPIRLMHMFPMLPSSIKKVDAAYQRADGKIVIFTGTVFWVYDGENFIEGSPKPLMHYGLPNYLNGIDAVHTWRRNGKTYFFKNERFWRYNEDTKTMDSGYPMHMSRWRGVPEYLDAATTWKDGATYFFKGGLFWKIDNNWVKTTDESPLPSPQVWFGCAEDSNNLLQWFSRSRES
ncbi:unnamed protein product [Phaedon cochleariae]|uniref:Peptidase metallopeptidase domain-containing protein n=1 Tax=Phaedon cochleariae TaxID=80249 RepID=A0A9N9X550_PHACE|nr:unnamed protein product [Phaedon cochleariae]